MKADLEGGAHSGTDLLAGGSESDRHKDLRVNARDDCLGGGTESYRLNGGSGEDLLKGGAGNDVINAKDGEPDRVRCGFGDHRATVGPTDAVKACEIVS
jgi:Ca2+-binding RTX toxin-like protein